MKKIIYSIILALALFSPLFLVHAQLSSAFGSSSTLQTTGNFANYKTNNTNLIDTIGQVILLVLELVGTIFIILIIYGGIESMTAGGNEEKASKAGKIIKGSIIGLIIVIGAYAISYYLIKVMGNSLIN